MMTCVSVILFLYAFVYLRIQNSDLPRPFRLPGGNIAAVTYAIPPFVVCVITLAFNFMSLFNAFAFICVLTMGLAGQLIYRIISFRDSATTGSKGTEAEADMSDVSFGRYFDTADMS